ncbi:ABC transporter substrate-binding protein [Shewanella pneumatophori]|uniref:ABC transporter substrate-binding protein n=1 Tax=Shewanella pneumatophori TaxID=314092 RepID=A0A9X1ZAD4_9GAMM|nr:ABC transporter substrate-binding protein [Shewanella pneumatophori]MCL1137382.1 ABC transporter substrate-binding protein [Shewanella pneumatophori]
MYKLLIISLFFTLPQYSFAANDSESKPAQSTKPDLTTSLDRVVSLNQHVTEALLALHADKQIIGISYNDDKPAERWVERFNALPSLSKEYPNPEILLSLQPQLVIAGFNSAFSDWGIGPRQRWTYYGVDSYLFKSGEANAVVSMATIFGDITNLGQLLGREHQAYELIDSYKKRLNVISKLQTKPRVLLWLREYDIPYVAGCCGAGNLLIEQAGGINIGQDINSQWGHMSWESVVALNPDVILMVDSNWSSFSQKQSYVESQPLSFAIHAVESSQLLKVGFSETVAGVRLIDGIELVNAYLEQVTAL